MRSSNVTTKHEGVVRCRIVHEEIPERICGFEQGVPECTGCTASTRRCTACGKTRGIADPEQGWCESCVEKRGSSAPRQALEGSPAMALTKALDRVRTVSAQLGETKGPIAQKGVGPSQALPGPMRVMSDPAAFYPLLMEHGVERNGI